MEWFLFWILCVVASTMIGARKGAPVAGFFLGVFFGPFGILFAVLIRGDYVRCAFCKELIRFDATVCPHCRKDVPSKSPPKKTETT
jgi:hypothetical protein